MNHSIPFFSFWSKQNALLGISSLLLMGGVSAFGAQSGAAAAPQNPSAPEAKAESRAKSVDAETKKLIDQLGSSNFEQRDEAIEALRRKGKAVLPALDDAAAQSDDPELRWNARRLARDLRDGLMSTKPGAAASPKADDSVRKPGQTARVRTFTLPQGVAPDVQWDGANMQQFEQQIREMERQMRDLSSNFRSRFRVVAPRVQFWNGGNGSFSSSSNGVKVEMNDHQVRVEVTETDADGHEERKTYEAQSMDEFKEKYPEVAQKYLEGGRMGGALGGNFSFEWPGGTAFVAPGGSWDVDQDQKTPVEIGGADLSRVIGPDNGQRLGVQLEPVPSDVRRFLGISDEVGAVIGSVENDTQAADLGLKSGDLIVSINGKKVGADTSIREALAAVPTGEKLAVEVIRGAEGRKTFEAAKRKIEPKAEAEAPASDPSELKPVKKAKKVQR